IVKTIGNRRNILDEILNDALLGIWDNINSYDPNRSSFKNWCAGVAKYKAIDAIRKEVKHDCLDLDDVSAFIDDKNLENFDESEKILEILPKKDREIFKKLFIEGYSYDDLEKITKIPKDRLYNKISRAKKTLRSKL
ncbi:MAG: sigma-70 family RNA polymerase sigma factor, partial [Anaerococcus vaginalis]|nr:sigma-70 family RNA polymerase sigma factor [Anaerococcus vaginalis]